MSGSGLGHQLLGADVIKGNFQQRVAAHFHDGDHHTLAKSGMGNHIALIKIQGHGLGRGSQFGGFAALDMFLTGQLLCGGLVLTVAAAVGAIGRTVSTIGRSFRLGLDATLMNDTILGNFVQETGFQSRIGTAIEHTLLGVADGQSLLGSGDGYIAQAALFFHLFLITDGAHAGEQTVFEAYQEHMGEFQTFGRVHGHHDHGIVGVIVGLQIGIEGDFFQETCQSGCFRILDIGVDGRFQFSDVLQASLVFFRGLCLEGGHITAALQQLIIEVRQRDTGFQQFGHAFNQSGELQQLHGGLFQGTVGIGIGNDAVQRLAFGLGQALGGLHGLGADATGRVVDDTLQTKIVGAVIDDAEIGQHILDFRTVKEAHTADDPVRNAVALQGKFQCVGLGIGAVQNGIVLEILALGAGNDLTGNIVTFGTFVVGFVDGNGVAAAVGRPEPLALSTDVVGDDRIGGIQNRLGGAVILLQTDNTGTAVLLFEGQDILDGGTPETVNTLIIVADDTNVLITAGQQAGQQILDMVGILILIYFKSITVSNLTISAYQNKKNLSNSP